MDGTPETVDEAPEIFDARKPVRGGGTVAVRAIEARHFFRVRDQLERAVERASTADAERGEMRGALETSRRQHAAELADRRPRTALGSWLRRRGDLRAARRLRR